jgi:hypothetical protein
VRKTRRQRRTMPLNVLKKSDKWRYTLRSKNRRKDEYCATSGGNA